MIGEAVSAEAPDYDVYIWTGPRGVPCPLTVTFCSCIALHAVDDPIWYPRNLMNTLQRKLRAMYVTRSSGDPLILTSRPQDLRLDRTSTLFKAPQFRRNLSIDRLLHFVRRSFGSTSH
jgi:hypothetical protein